MAFLALVFVNSAGVLPVMAVEWGNDASRWCLVMAIAAIGMKTQIRDIVSVGWRPVGLMVLETLMLALFVTAWLHLKPVGS